ncbi:hypothetical protein IWW34DRAFT_291847 [Fusarium oxysporum f. sp. albedinis]|nr:hypothetical protein IWW34DRAFT_291847 [Fusarium oxysporum f. sp. albedinis]KAJ0135534.1 Uncharacterized protein HZ326_21435 [Fusarium oxysporum f. sp. albedinis]
MDTTRSKTEELEDVALKAAQVPLPAESLSSYERMVVESHEVPLRWNFLASISNWLLLAGFIVFPGTFTSISRSRLLDHNQAGRVIQRAVRNVPLLYIGSLSCIVGILGILWAWWNLKHNWFWLVYRIFLPGLLNALMALLTGLTNVYTAQDGDWSVAAIVTVSIAGFCSLFMGLMLLLYQFWFLRLLKQH